MVRAQGIRRGTTSRLIAATAVAATALTPLLVATPPATAATQVSLTATPHGLLTGNVASFSGKVTTRQHRLVRLQVLAPTGGWVNAGKTRTLSRGRYTVADRASRTGQYRVILPRARVAGRTLAAVTSAPVTVGMASDLENGQTLQPGQFLTSPDGTHLLTMRPDGNLVVTTTTDPNTILWSASTSTSPTPGSTTTPVPTPGARLVMQYGGNLVLVDPTNLLLWNTGTSDTSRNAALSIGNDGTLSVHDGATVLWDSVNGVHVPTDPVGTSQAAVRGQTWVDAKVAYSQSKYYTNSLGRYRTDCSGFVSLMWGLSSSYTTRTIPSISTVITKDQLVSGDVLNSPGYHVVLFDAWADAAHTRYWAYEETPSTGATHRVVPYPYWSSSRPGTFVPRRLS